MSQPTSEFTNIQINAFVDMFEEFDRVLVARANPDVHITLSDKIALFAIYQSRT